MGGARRPAVDTGFGHDPIREDVGMNSATKDVVAYQAPALRGLGSVHVLTQGCDKMLGGSDRCTFMGQAIVCVSP